MRFLIVISNNNNNGDYNKLIPLKQWLTWEEFISNSKVEIQISRHRPDQSCRVLGGRILSGRILTYF